MNNPYIYISEYDQTIWMEWISADARFAIVIDPVSPKESSWYLVSKGKEDNQLSGYLPKEITDAISKYRELIGS